MVSLTLGSAAPLGEAEPVRYVALGDSYTIGTGVGTRGRWPNQLVARLHRDGDAGPRLRLVRNLAMEGCTSGDVVAEQLPRLVGLRPGFATVLVGVNDVLAEVPPDEYRGNVETILDALLARLPAERLVVLSVPDHTVTPRGSEYGDPAQGSAAIVEVNAISRELAAEREVPFVDVFEISRRAATTSELVADDGLHPSAAQYRLWVDRLEPVVRRLLTRPVVQTR